MIWNEPNKAIWLKPASPETYVQKLLNPAYRRIKAVNRAARVAGGVTAPRGGQGGISPVDFIRRMDAAGARLDVYAHHPYPVYPGDTPLAGGCSCKTITMATLDRLLKLVGQAFPSARIWLTEYAYQTNPPDVFGVTPQLQARFIGEAAWKVYTAPKVDLLIHYLYRDEPDLGRWQSGLETTDGRGEAGAGGHHAAAGAALSQRLAGAALGAGAPGQRRAAVRHPATVRLELDGGREAAASRTRTGFFSLTVRASKQAKLRLWYPSGRVGEPAASGR